MSIALLLFLDFDGVLHRFFPEAGRSDEENSHFYYLPWFEGALRQMPGAYVVIASTWRNKYSLDQLRSRFSADIRARIIGATPFSGQHTDGSRHDEVVAWLAENNHQNTPWIGIDDMPALYRPGDCVVMCPDMFGPVQQAKLMEAARAPGVFARNHPVKH